jgi:four helix bundle protein
VRSFCGDRGSACAQKEQCAMSTIKSHRELEAWQVAMDLVDRIYDLTEVFPDKERFGLQAQLRRAAVSVPSNVAEGHSRPLRAALNHLSIAVGSLAEIDTQMEIGRRRGYFAHVDLGGYAAVHESTSKLIRGLGRAKKMLLLKTAASATSAVILAAYVLSLSVW